MYSKRHDPFDNRPWSLEGDEPEDNNVLDSARGRRKDVNEHYSSLQSLRINKRKEEWKKVLNEGKNKELPPSQNSLRDLASRKSVSCLDVQDNRQIRNSARMTKTAEIISEPLSLRARRIRGELVQNTKRSLKTMEEETEGLAAMRAKRREEMRERTRERTMKQAEQKRLLELEMSSPLARSRMPRKVTPPAQRALPRKRIKVKSSEPEQTKKGGNWWETMLMDMASFTDVTCCAGKEETMDAEDEDKAH